jgi:hypothetical protein
MEPSARVDLEYGQISGTPVTDDQMAAARGHFQSAQITSEAGLVSDGLDFTGAGYRKDCHGIKPAVAHEQGAAIGMQVKFGRPIVSAVS